jgi:D-lactate dehydrogenase (cytochrome)
MENFAASLLDRFGNRLITSDAARVQYAQSEGYHRHEPPAIVAQPDSVEDVQLLVRQAAAHEMPVVAYGAGTSLEGNAAATHPNTLCIDFSRMNRIVDVSPDDLLCVVEPGVTREQLNEDIRATGLFFPVDPGANASLGGMISTRASGTTTVRYGSMRDNILALKVVTADGRLILTGTRARKSASGYDLTHARPDCRGDIAAARPARQDPRGYMGFRQHLGCGRYRHRHHPVGSANRSDGIAR